MYHRHTSITTIDICLEWTLTNVTPVKIFRACYNVYCTILNIPFSMWWFGKLVNHELSQKNFIVFFLQYTPDCYQYFFLYTSKIPLSLGKQLVVCWEPELFFVQSEFKAQLSKFHKNVHLELLVLNLHSEWRRDAGGYQEIIKI